MSDDLVTNIVLRQRKEREDFIAHIEALEAENARLREALSTARAALEHAKHNMPHPDQMVDDVLALIDQPIASTEGGE